MTREKALAEYARRSLEFEGQIKEMKEAFRNIDSMLYSIGGPLNDNVHRYNKNQLKIFFRIKDEIEGFL